MKKMRYCPRSASFSERREFVAQRLSIMVNCLVEISPEIPLLFPGSRGSAGAEWVAAFWFGAFRAFVLGLCRVLGLPPSRFGF